jgi:hypothetical protein
MKGRRVPGCGPGIRFEEAADPIRAGRYAGQGRVFCLALVLLFSWAAAAAADISGVVRDQTGQRLAGAAVELTNLQTGLVHRTRSDDQGRFGLFSLPPGVYDLTVALEGFRKETRRGLSLAVSQHLVADITLQLGSVAEEITVVERVDAVDLASLEVSSLVDEKRVDQMPLQGRDWVALSQLSPGVVQARRAGYQSSTNMPTGRISVSGQRAGAANFKVDGVDVNIYSTVRPPGGVADGTALGLESIKELRVVATNFSAEHGNKSGGLIEVVSKSGSNELRGSGYFFHRNAALEARDFFDPGEESESHRNQFGASLGGPIAPNRSFFFLNYEGLRERKSLTSSGVTPTRSARQGLLPVAGGAGFETIHVDPLVIPFLGLYPLPNGQDFGNGTGLWTGKGLRKIRQDYWALRFDHSFGERSRLFARYSGDDGWAELPFPASDFPGFARSPEGRDHLAAIGFTHYRNATTLNDLTLGFHRSGRGADLVSPNPNGLAFSLIPGSSFGSLRVGGLGTLGNTTRPVSDLLQNVYQAADSLTMIRGRHSLKLGLEYKRFQINNVQEINTNGTVIFSSLRAFLENRAASYRGVFPPSDFARASRFSQYAFFVHDKLSVARTMTLNLGLRYEPWTNVTDANGKISVLLDPLAARGEEDFQVVEKLFRRNPSLGNWGPRAGIAWDPLGDGSSSIRAGIGIYHDCPYNGGLFAPVMAVPPFVNSVQIDNPGFPEIQNREGDFRRTLSPNLLEYDGRRWPSVLQYHVSVQRRLPGDSLLSAGWVGGRGVHLLSRRELNSRVPVILEDGRKYFPADAPRKNPNLSSIILLAMDARSWYDSLQVSLRRSYGRGFTLTAFYTLGKAIDEATPAYTTLEVSGDPMIRMDSDNLRLDKGLGVFDVRHNFSASLLWIPVRDWQIGGLITLASGHPFTPLVSFNCSRSGVGGATAQADRPNLRAGYGKNPVVGKVAQWYDPAAFELPEAGFLGNLGRNTLIGPGFRNLDFLISRDFRMRGDAEGPHFQLRAEFFNALNHPNFDLPGSSVTAGVSNYLFTDHSGSPNPAAAQLTQTQGSARQVQIGVKLVW